MALKCLQQPARPGVPQLDRVVVRCRRKRLAVARECYGPDGARMALESLQQRIPIILDLR